MDEEQKYKLITCVDPRKINVPIRDRFSKLTLSNKKKQPEITDADHEDIEEKLEDIKRASRNLLEALDNTTETKSSTGFSHIDNPQYINPLLRSESSSIPATQINGSHLKSSLEPLSLNSKYTDNMEPLQVSENINQPDNDNLVDQQISTLTRAVSTMAVSVRKSNVNTSDKIQHETTLLVSTESQRMSYELRTPRLQTCTITTDDKEESMAERDVTQPSCISLSSTGDDSGSAITVTDSSISDFVDFDVLTSEIPESGRSADVFLPQTFSNDRADRMEAFLRDVSQQRREIEENGILGEDNFTLLSANDEKQTEKCLKKDENVYKKIAGLAYADTESMTTYSVEPRKTEDYVKLMQEGTGHQINIKLEKGMDNDTLSMSRCTLVDLQACTSKSVLNNEKDQHSDSQRLAFDDTEVNTSSLSEDVSKLPWFTTTLRQSTEHEIKDRSIICSDQSFNSAKQDIPEDSVVISETSSENMSCYSVHDTKRTSADVMTGDCSQAIDAGSTQSQISPQMGISTISISAKINIQISITQVDSLEDEYDKDSEDNEKVSQDETYTKVKSPLSDNEVQLETTCNDQKRDRSKINESNAIENNMNTDINAADEEEEDLDFLTHAERLLNQVYGKSWQTPEVIRTLKRSSRTPKKNSTLSPQANKTPISFKEANSIKDLTKPVPEPTSGGKVMDQSAEQSVLDDFSIFRRDIVRTNLDSTRFNTPKQYNKEIEPKTEHFNTEPRVMAQSNVNQLRDFKVPRTEFKKKLPNKQRRQNIIMTSAERWRQIVDDDSDTSGDYASDDDTLDKTENNNDSTDDDKENKIAKDKAWTNSPSSNNSDNEITRPRKGVKGQPGKQSKHKSPSKVKITDARARRKAKVKSNNALIYLDLSKDEVTIQEGEQNSPPANHDVNFNTRLESILCTCKATDKPKLPSTPNTGSKRKLFTANFGDEDIDLTIGDGGVQPRTPVKPLPPTNDDEIILQEMEQVNLNDGLTGGFAIFNKNLEFIKSGDPIFKVTPPRSPTTPRLTPETPKQPTKPSRILRECKKLADNLWPTPKSKYGFLKSLDVCVSKSLCHPDALSYRENYRTKKEELAKLLYELYNEKLFDNKLNIPLQWNKKLCNTAGRCLNKKKMGVRTSVVELSEKVLTSADRLRCTLIHELCHAATWIFSGEGGHGSTWKQWALKANSIFPEIPKIGVCHQYDIEYKYTYKCTLCAAKSHAHSKSKKVENIRCSFCHGAIEIYLNKKDKDGNILPTPVREPTGFAKFVKDNYKQYKRPDLKHADVMKLLSAEFAAMKIPNFGN
ncbi:germ cell nuclear acidic protein-like [Eurosta solidaginis]|uniref:germ cell nuclear acidic protein-like n=1 Tax=Eurosta solidaginis TaxID=178769 RepID=UPI003530869B